jgi:anaerobic selenocysteine-containing dehydrogenase
VWLATKGQSRLTPRVLIGGIRMSTRKIHGYCSLCIARCGCVATVEDGRFTRLDPDPSHPTGQALCAKGRAAPELVYSKDRLMMPLRRTRPKGDADPGWVEISWEQALDETAAALRRIADAHGPESIVFGQCSPSTTAIADSAPYVRRLMHALGTPNMAWALDMCGWSRAFATRYAYGHAAVATGSAGGAMADIDNAGCMILWGYNPSSNRLTHATATVAAQKRGMKLIVIDPRRAGLANKADIWLRVRPGTDGALALGLAHVMIRNGWFDRAFVRDWTNAHRCAPAICPPQAMRATSSPGTAPSAEPSPTIPRPAAMTARRTISPWMRERRSMASPAARSSPITPPCARPIPRRRWNASAGSPRPSWRRPPASSGNPALSPTTRGAGMNITPTPRKQPARWRCYTR